MTSAINENDLIRRAKEGDQSAWAALIKTFEGVRRKIVAKAVRRGVDEDDAESLTYEAFVGSVKRFDFDAGVKFITYLWNAMEFAVKRADHGGAIYLPRGAYSTDVEAASRARSIASLDAPRGIDDDGSSMHSFVADESTDRLGVDNEDYERLRWALSLLDDRNRLIIERRLAGKKHHEIAGERGVSTERVRTLAEKAQEHLQSLLSMERVKRWSPSRNKAIRKPHRWQRVEIDALKRMVPNSTICAVALQLGRPITSTYNKSRELGLRSGNTRLWTPQDHQFLIANRGNGWVWCAEQLKLPATMVRSYARRVGIQNKMLRRPELARVRELVAAGLTNAEIGDALGVSRECIWVNLRRFDMTANKRDENKRVATLKKNLHRKYGVSTLAAVRRLKREQFVKKFEFASDGLPAGAVVVGEAIRRINRPCTCHEIANELRRLAEQMRACWFPKTWKRALLYGSVLHKAGRVVRNGGVNTPMLFSIRRSP